MYICVHVHNIYIFYEPHAIIAYVCKFLYIVGQIIGDTGLQNVLIALCIAL